MIIGNGDIAKVLKDGQVDRPNFIFFASGVSNSQETDKNEYKREYDLLMAQDKSKHIVYFSSLAVFYGDTDYIRHKKFMETQCELNFDAHTIVRLGNIAWGNNPHTFINYLMAHPEAEIKDEYRHVIDMDEFIYWINLIPDWNCEMNIPGARLKVRDALTIYGHA